MVGDAPAEPFELIVTAEEAGKRLDHIVTARELGPSRSTWQRWIQEGRVRVDGQPVKAKARPAEGARLRVAPAPPPPSEAEPQDIPLDILYEDAHLLVLDKPAGLVVHPAAGHPDGTLVNALLHHAQLADADDSRRPGIVHRLDKDTSGVMVVAKDAAAREGLIRRLKHHDIERSYLAIAVGVPPDRACYDTWHGRHPVDRKRFTSKLASGKRAVTKIEVVERLHGAALVRCTLETGRTHQIRVHLAEHGHPILGDPLYAKPPRDARLRALAASLGRQALHAEILGFEHPVRKRWLHFRAQPPADFRQALEALRDGSDEAAH